MGKFFRQIWKTAFTSLLVFTCAAACAAPPAAQPATTHKEQSEITAPQQLNVVTTSGFLADAATQIAPTATVSSLIGPGGDPHSYQPTTNDIEQLREADAVLSIGLELEAHLTDPLAKLGASHLAVGDQLPTADLIELPNSGGTQYYDPHIWNDPAVWQQVVLLIADHLSTIDPQNTSEYQTNAAEYNQKIAIAHEAAAARLASVKAPRTLVTGHDAFNYLGRTYDLRIRATDKISSSAALSATEINELAEFIAVQQIPVIFYDSQTNPQAIKSLSEAVAAKGGHVRIATAELYADTLGTTAETDSYLDVLRYNTEQIAAALG